MEYWPYVIGVGFVLVVFAFYKLAIGGAFSRLYEGADGRLSTSKFQFFLWTIVVLFSYATLFAVKLLQSPPNFNPITSLPENVLIALGMSVVSASGAKAITVNYINTNRISKAPPRGGRKIGQIFQDDSGVPDLSKLQMIAWTFIAIVTYLIAVVHNVSVPNAELPDIDKSLMALMGLGHTAYLAKKAVSTDTAPAGTTQPPTNPQPPANSANAATGGSN